MTPALLLTGSSHHEFVDIHVEPVAWAVLLGIIVVLLLVDLLVLHRHAHEIGTKEAALESAGWISVGLLFGVGVWLVWGGRAGGEYFAGYLIEKSLSVDNVFVWAVIFSYFAVPRRYQHRVLFWGIFGALVLRAVFIVTGVALINRFDWVLYVFGAFLLVTAFRLAFRDEEEVHPERNPVLRAFRKVVPSTTEYDGQKLVTRQHGRTLATPLFAVLVMIEVTDVIFAVDSVPAVLAVSHETFIVFSSNAFAILGLRSLYFLLADMHGRFEYLNDGLAVILAFVGLKMIVARWWHIPTWASLAFIALVLVVAVALSILKARREARAAEAALPPVQER